MSGNANPIYSRQGSIQGGTVLTLAAGDYVGANSNNQVIFIADSTNGGFVQRLRFKALGTNTASVARVYINDGTGSQANTVLAATTPTGTPSSSGGFLPSATYYARVQAEDAFGQPAPLSPESTGVSVTGPNGSISWTWTAVTNANSYNIFVGLIPSGTNLNGAEQVMFTTTTNSFTQTDVIGSGMLTSAGNLLNNNIFYGEVSLPATTASQTAGTVDIDYPVNFALPPGYRVIVGLGTTVAAGWMVSTIGGAY